MPDSQHYFVALYSGRTVSTAELVAASANPELVQLFVSELLNDPAAYPDNPDDEPDAIRRAINRGQRNALHLLIEEMEDDEHE